MTTKTRPETLAPQMRTASMRLLAAADGKRTVQVDDAARTAQLAFSSEEPCDMWYGTEILSHAPGAMRTGVRQQTMPMLFNHDMDDLLGVVEAIEIGADGIGRATVRFGKDERGDWAMKQVADGILVNVSFMYRVYKWLEDTEADTVTATDWEPLEITLCTVPADPTVGVGRSASADVANGVQLQRAAVESPAPVAQTIVLHQPQEHSMNLRKQRLLEQVTGEASPSGTGQSAPAAGTSLSATSISNGESARAADLATQQRGAEGERARMTEIEALSRKYSLSPELRTQLIQRGATIEQARLTAADVVLERAQKSGSV
ncbi:MAG TPA: HK97 family phage prohead protease, partial [Rhodoferax sp.]